jgi:hypothetical protein
VTVPTITPPDAAATESRAGATSRATVVGTLVVIGIIYVLSLVGYALLRGPVHLPPPDVVSGQPGVVLLQLTDVDAKSDAFTTQVSLFPEERLQDPRTGALLDDVTIVIWGPTGTISVPFRKGEFGDTAQRSITVAGDADKWPLDRYTTGELQVYLLQGSGANQMRLPVRVEVGETMEGWDIQQHTVDRAGSHGPESVTTLSASRSKASLMFDFGICLVLVALPATALFVAIETVRGRRKFLPPLTTWFAAMLFSIVPLRTILPGTPTAGAWIDQALFLWVLLALGGAMVIYIVAWWRQAE